MRARDREPRCQANLCLMTKEKRRDGDPAPEPTGEQDDVQEDEEREDDSPVPDFDAGAIGEEGPGGERMDA